jgi:TonB family protein
MNHAEPQATAAGHLSVHFDHQHPADVPFLFEQQTTRMGQAIGFSGLSHVLVFVLAFLVVRYAPKPQAAALVIPQRPNIHMIWLPEPGPGGGGGGGGNQMPEPPRKAEVRGKDKIAIPVTKPPQLENPKPKDEPKPEQELTIPAKMLGATEQTLPGVVEGTSASIATTSQGPGTGGGSGTGNGTGSGPGSGSGLGPGSGGNTGGGVYRPGNGIDLPRVLREVKPQYTADAMRAKVQGTVLIECVVERDGSVDQVHIIRSLDPTFGLDQEAVKAAKQWRFAPGMRMGEPVPVLITIELTFTLR